MHVLPIAEIPRELTASWGSLVWSDRDSPFDRTFLRRARSLGIPFADYLGLVAVEGPEVLAQVMVGHYRLTTARGTEEFAGIENVVARPDALRRGLGTALLSEVHRREAESGHRWALLWTQRSWGAHRLYERLGYRDIYSPPTAIRPPGRTRGTGFRRDSASERPGTEMRRSSPRSFAGRRALDGASETGSGPRSGPGSRSAGGTRRTITFSSDAGARLGTFPVKRTPGPSRSTKGSWKPPSGSPPSSTGCSPKPAGDGSSSGARPWSTTRRRCSRSAASPLRPIATRP